MKIFAGKKINLLKPAYAQLAALVILVLGLPFAVMLSNTPQPEPHAQSVSVCQGSCLVNTCSSYNSPKIIAGSGSCQYGGYCCESSSGNSPSATVKPGQPTNTPIPNQPTATSMPKPTVTPSSTGSGLPASCQGTVLYGCRQPASGITCSDTSGDNCAVACSNPANYCNNAAGNCRPTQSSPDPGNAKSCSTTICTKPGYGVCPAGQYCCPQ